MGLLMAIGSVTLRADQIVFHPGVDFTKFLCMNFQVVLNLLDQGEPFNNRSRCPGLWIETVMNDRIPDSLPPKN